MKQCPNERCNQSKTPEVIQLASGRHYVYCSVCELHGPIGKDRAHGVDAWDTLPRAALPPVQSVSEFQYRMLTLSSEREQLLLNLKDELTKVRSDFQLFVAELRNKLRVRTDEHVMLHNSVGRLYKWCGEHTHHHHSRRSGEPTEKP